MDNIKEVVEMCIDEEKDNRISATNRFVGFREMQMPLKSVTVSAMP